MFENAKAQNFLLVKHIKDAKILSPIKFNNANTNS